MDGCRLFCLFAKNWSHGILGLLQHNHPMKLTSSTKQLRPKSAKNPTHAPQQAAPFLITKSPAIRDVARSTASSEGRVLKSHGARLVGINRSYGRQFETL